MENRCPYVLLNIVVDRVPTVLKSLKNYLITVENKALFCAIPFESFKTTSLSKYASRENIKGNYKHLEKQLVFVNSFEVGSFFIFKDRAPTSLVSNI